MSRGATRWALGKQALTPAADAAPPLPQRRDRGQGVRAFSEKIIMTKRPWLPYAVLFAAVLIASSSSIMIRLLGRSYGVPAITTAAGRLALAALILAPLALGRAGGELRRLPRRALLLALASGVFLAMHFASWVSSLDYTSVASSAVLVTTTPIWVGLAGFALFRERLGRAALVGIALTLAGSALIALSDGGGAAGGANPLLGDALALLGAITVTGYLLIGRALRSTMSILAYIWLVYTSAALVLLATMLLSGQTLLGYPWPVYLLLLGLAVGPQLLSHTSFTWALKYLSAAFIAVAILGEPVGSALLAWALLGEGFAPLQLIGFVVLLAGIVVAARAERTSSAAPQRSAELRAQVGAD